MAIDINIESQVSQTITDGVTDKAPSENAVFDALALKIGGAVSIGQVAFGTASGVGGDTGLTWDNTNKRLGIGTSTPTARLHVQSQGALSTYIAFRVRNSADTGDIIRAQGDGRVYIGQGAGRNINTATQCTLFGFQAGFTLSTQVQCTAFGERALQECTSNGASAFGSGTLISTTNAFRTSAFGVDAGRYIADGTTANAITTDSVFFGGSTRAQANNQTNQVVIGFGAIGNGSNTVTLGNTSIVKTFLRGTINAANLPTSATGLVAGDIWNDAGTLKIV